MKKYLLVLLAALSLFAVLAPLGASAQGNSPVTPFESVTVVNVYASEVWNNTGVTLTPGMSVTISASGTVYRAESDDAYWTNDPIGRENECGGACTVPSLPMYSLIGQIGTGAPFYVGTGPVTVSGEGTLSLAFNDGQYTDNSGYFVATISYECLPGNGFGDKNHTHCGAPGQN